MTLVIDQRTTVQPSTGRQPNSPNVQIPHMNWPFQFGRNADGSISAGTVEQDTLDEVGACVQAILACPIGFRDELPPFGIPPLEFAQAPINPTGVQQALSVWEERVSTFAEEWADASSPAWRHVALQVTSSGAASDQSSQPPTVIPPHGDPDQLLPSPGLFPGPHVLP